MTNYFFYLLIWILSFNNNEITQIIKEEKKCIDCHQDCIDKKVAHAPAVDNCLTCHESNGNKHPKKDVIAFKLTEQIPVLCHNCHEPFSKKKIHSPSAAMCSYCHSPHSTNNHSLILKKKTSDLCVECHSFHIPPIEIKHKPVSDGNCEGCHDPHQSDQASFLKSSVPDLCYTCHENTQALQSAENVHPPFVEECATCHKSHSSTNNKLLTEKMPVLCYMCHDGVLESINNSKSAHGVINGKKSCAGCHSPHGSAYDKFLYVEGKDLCLKCHNRTIKTKTGKVANIKDMLKETNSIHPVIEDGCVLCHMPHAADYPKLLNAPFPQGYYVEAKVGSFEMCFNCHDSELLTNSNTESTNFRDGNRNMHYLHINGPKARNCIVCHNIHGSPNEHLINEKIPFGDWEMPFTVSFNNEGGTCHTGCHEEKHYNRINPGVIVEIKNEIDSNITIEDTTNIANGIEFNIDDYKIIDYSTYYKKDTSSVSSNQSNDTSIVLSIDDDVIESNTEISKVEFIRFDFDTINISNDIERDLRNIVVQMKNNSNYFVEIECYTDNVGEEEDNKAISLLRANVVKKLLIERGISAERISCSGYGEANPITLNDTEEGRLVNRRIEFVFYTK